MKKMFSMVLCAVLATAVGTTSAFAGSTPKGKPFVAINGQVVEVQKAISTIQDQIALLVGQVGSMEERLTASEGAIQDLISQNAEISALINGNITSVDQIAAKIDSLNAETATLESMLQSVGTDPDLENQVKINTELINTLSSALAGVNSGIINLEGNLQSQIDNNSTLISALQSDIDQINLDLAQKQNIISGNCLDGSAVQQILENGDVVCGEAGMSGQLETKYSYVQAFANPNQFIQAVAICPEGYTVTGAGYASAAGWEISSIYTEIGAAGNYAVVQATNRNSFRDDIVPVANCMRVAP